MIRLLEFLNHALFWYYLASNISYLVMLIVALQTSAAHQRRLQSYRLDWFKDLPLAPPITIIAPALNEENSIRVAVRNLLDLDYPHLEVIIVVEGNFLPSASTARNPARIRMHNRACRRHFACLHS
jgi:cellulose synthase/poly-beta-1,6-N-acetylglucosamine synthase-like glycosyltransferase